MSGVAVVSDYGGYCREQAHRSRDQCLGDRRRHDGQRRRLHVGQPHERAHDAPHGSKQTDVGAGRANRGQCREALFEPVDFAHLRDAHGTATLFDQSFPG